MSKKSEKEESIRENMKYLKKMIKPGDTVYTTLKHVSRSGMYRVIELFIMHDNQIVNITGSVSIVIDHKYDSRHNGIGIGGCGMDMGFAIVYSLSRSLFHDGFQCPGKNCPSNDHFNLHTDRDGKTFHSGDGGYAINHRWM